MHNKKNRRLSVPGWLLFSAAIERQVFVSIISLRTLQVLLGLSEKKLLKQLSSDCFIVCKERCLTALQDLHVGNTKYTWDYILRSHIRIWYQILQNVGYLELKSDRVNKLKHMKKYVKLHLMFGKPRLSRLFLSSLFCMRLFKNFHVLLWWVNNKSTSTICCTLTILILVHQMMPALMAFLI